jgi:radical SAM protein with 4Fe4S-binding SPASM domain
MIYREIDVTEKNLKRELGDIKQRINISSLNEAMRFPKYFQLETIRICNAHCPFCPVDEWDKTTPLISQELFDKVVDEMSHHADWIEFVAIQRAGEPLLDKKIVPRVKQLKDAGIKKVTMSTNASRLFEDKAVGLLEAGLDEIMLSIDAVDKENYEKTRVGLNYEEVLSNIKRFFHLRDQIKPDCMIRVRGVSFYDISNLMHQQALKQWESFWAELKNDTDRIYMKKAHSWGNQKVWEGHTPDFGDVFHPCVLPWSTMHITAMGQVALCGQDFDGLANLGDLNEQSIAEVWQGEKFQNVRKKHSSGCRNDIEYCQGCRLFDLDNNLENWQQKRLSDS